MDVLTDTFTILELPNGSTGRVDMSLKQTPFQLQFRAIYFIRDQIWS